MMLCMGWIRKQRDFLSDFEERLERKLASLPARVESLTGQHSALSITTTAAWVTGAIAVIAAGLYAGRELRSRYKFKRRTPYDYYAHAGDPSDLEFGVGI